MSGGLNQLDPQVAAAEGYIEKQKLPPDKAVDYLLSKGVDPRLASLVMKYRMLKQSAANQPKPQQQTTVAQDVDGALAQRGQGVAGLPVPNQMYACGGGIVAFDGGGMSGPTDPTDLAAVQQQQLYQNIADQQMQQQAQSIGQMAGGGVVAFDEGGDTDDDEDTEAQQQAIYKQQLKEWQRRNAQNYLQSGTQLGVAPPQQQARGGQIKHLDGGGPAAPYDPLAGSGYTAQVQGFQQQQAAAAAQQAQQDQQIVQNFSPQRDQTNHQAVAQYIQAKQRLAANPPGIAPPGARPTPAPTPAPAAAPVAAAKPAAPTPLPPGGFAQTQGIPGPQPQQQPSAPTPASVSGGASVQIPGRSSVPMNAQGVPLAEEAAIKQQQGAVDAAAPQSIQQNLATIQDMAEKQGIGAASKHYVQYIDQLGKQIETYKSQGNWMAIAKAGFAMAQAATYNPHGGFLGALAVGGQAGAEAYQENMNKYRDLSMKLNEQKYVVQQSLENVHSEQNKEAVDMYVKQQERYDTLQGRVWTAQDNMMSRVLQRQIASDAIKAQAQYRMMYNPTQIFAEKIANSKPGSPEYLEALQQAKDFYGTQPQVQAADVRTGGTEQAALDRLYTNPSYVQAFNEQYSHNPQAAARGRALVQQMEATARGQQTGALTPQQPAGLTYDPATGTFK